MYLVKYHLQILALENDCSIKLLCLHAVKNPQKCFCPVCPFFIIHHLSVVVLFESMLVLIQQQIIVFIQLYNYDHLFNSKYHTLN